MMIIITGGYYIPDIVDDIPIPPVKYTLLKNTNREE